MSTNTTEQFTNWVRSEKYPGDQILECDRGRIWLERCDYSDRGNFVVKNDYYPGPINLLITAISGAYYFDESYAKSEVTRWLELGAGASDEKLRSLKLSDPVSSFEIVGKQCVVTIRKHILLPLNVDVVIGDVVVNEDAKKVFSVDWADNFSRTFLDGSIALAELTAWMYRRGQLD